MIRIQLLTILSILLVGVTACQGGDDGPDRSVLGDVLDPEMYRAEIQSLENDLYAYAYDVRVRAAVGLKLEDLAGKVAENDGALPMIYCVEMRRLAEAARRGQDSGFVRSNWERIRGSLFGDAVWYRWRHAPKRLQVAAQTVGPVDDQVRRDYAYVLRKLDDLVARGRRDAERMGEPEARTTDYFNGDYRDLVAEWESWAGDWRDKLAYAERSLPDQPGNDGNAALRLAHNNLLQAIQWLNAVPVGRGQWQTPFRNDWEKCFGRAEAFLDKARAQIEP